jgi:hypothetical protein
MGSWKVVQKPPLLEGRGISHALLKASSTEVKVSNVKKLSFYSFIPGVRMWDVSRIAYHALVIMQLYVL